MGHSRTAQGQTPKIPRQATDELWYFPVFGTFDPANRQSRKSVSKFDIKNQQGIRQKRWVFLYFYSDLILMLEELWYFQKASSCKFPKALLQHSKMIPSPSSYLGTSMYNTNERHKRIQMLISIIQYITKNTHQKKCHHWSNCTLRNVPQDHIYSYIFTMCATYIWQHVGLVLYPSMSFTVITQSTIGLLGAWT